MKETIKLRSGAIIYIDERNGVDVYYSSDFDIRLGKITNDYRFSPTNTYTKSLYQGYTPEMLSGLADLIRMKAGIGEKRDIPAEQEEEELTK